MTPDEYATNAAAVEEQIGRVIVGQRDLVRQVIVCLLCEGHVLLEGVPGLGKTQLLKTLSQAVDVEFSRIQFTPDLMPADILGTQVLEEDASGRRSFQFRAGPVFANLVLADEINRATPKTQSALLEAMQERAVTVAGQTRPLPRPFLVTATQNPIEMEGTYPLPEAHLDRFLLKVLVPFPPADDLVEVVERTTAGDPAPVERVAGAETLRAMIELTRQVPVASHLREHAVALIVATHPEGEGATEEVRRFVRFGASPRGAQALVLGRRRHSSTAGRTSPPRISGRSLRQLFAIVSFWGTRPPLKGSRPTTWSRRSWASCPSRRRECAAGIRG